MADIRDVELTKLCRREFVKRYVDVTLCDIHASHGIVYIRGVVRAVRGSSYGDVSSETERIVRLIRQRPEVREMILEVTYK